MLAAAAAGWTAATGAALAAEYGRLGAPAWVWGATLAAAAGVLAGGAVLGVWFRRRRARNRRGDG